MEVGIDIVNIKRIEDMQNLDSFLNKYFTINEIDYINSKKDRFSTIAGIYAAKEAILKAIKVGICNGIALKELEITHEKNGAPKVEVDAKLMHYLVGLNCQDIKISISHDGEYAVAIANIC